MITLSRYVGYNADGTLGTGRYRERPKYKTTGPEDRRRHQAARDRERAAIKLKPRRPDNKLTSIASIERERAARFGLPESENMYAGHDNDWAPTAASRFHDAHRAPSTLTCVFISPQVDQPTPSLIDTLARMQVALPAPSTVKKTQREGEEMKPDLFIDLVLDACPQKSDHNGAALTGSELRAATDDLARSLSRRDLESAKRSARLLLLQGRTNRSDLRAFCMRNL